MTTTRIEQARLLEPDVRGKLAALRAAISTRLLLEGLAWVVGAVVAGVFATLGLDYFFHLERPLRVGFVSAAGLGVLVVAWRGLVAPLRVPLRAGDIALLLERRFGQLGDRLISAIEFSTAADAEALGLSAAMMRRTAAEANRLARPLPVGQIVERRGLWRAWAVAGCAAALLLGFGLLRGELLGLWFQRNVLFAEVPWPQTTYLLIRGDPADFTVLRGDDLKVIVEVAPESLRVPHHVTLHAEYPTIGRTEEVVEPEMDSPRRFVKVFPAVAEEFSFYVTGGDDRRDAAHPHRVRLIDPPALLRVSFDVKYPAYMRRTQVERFAGGAGALPVPVGASVAVRAEANKPLRSAQILLDDRPVGAPMRRLETPPAGGREAFIGEFDVVGENRPAARTLRFALVDTAGHSNRGRGAKYVVQVLPDGAPTVDLKKRGIGAQVSPRAILPLEITARDDHGLSALEAVVRRVPGPADGNAGAVELGPDVGAEWAGRHEVDIEPLGLMPGTTLRVVARATDTLPESFGGPNVGESGSLTFRVVKAEDLLEELVRRQKEIRLEFVQALALQESARAKTAAAVELFGAGRVDAEGRRLLASSAGVQRNVGAEIAKAADGLRAIVEEMKNNRLGTDTGREQISTGIVQPLERLSDPVGKVGSALANTKLATAAADLAEQAGRIEQLQRELFRRMQEILERMVKLENKQELANKLRLIINWSEQLLESIRRKQEAEVGEVFEGTTQPARP